MAIQSTEVLEIKIDGLDLVEQGYKSIIKMQQQLEGTTQKTDQAVKKSASGFGKFQQNLITVGAAASTLQAGLGALQRVINSVKAPVNLAIDFERSFSRIETLLEGPKGAFDDLRQGLLDLASTVPQTAGDISSAAYQAISAGVPQAEVVEFLEAASKTAVAAGSSLTQSVELLTAATNAFGSQGVDAARASDIFFSTVREGVLTIESIQSVFGQGAALSSYGISLEEVGAALAALTKRGIPASESMTMLNAVVKLIASDTMPGAKAMSKLGIETGVAALESKGLTGVLAEVLEVTQGNTEVINTFGRRAEAIKGMINLLAGEMGNYNKALGANIKATGSTSDAYGKMSADTQGAIDRFKALSEDILRRMGESVLPAVNDALERLSDFIATEGPAMAKRLTDVAEAFLGFGVFVIENAATITNMLRGLFVGVGINQFAKSISLARVELVKFSRDAGTKALGGFATSIQKMGPALAGVFTNPAIFGPAIVGAMMVGGLLGDALGKRMAENFAIVSETEVSGRVAELRHTVDSLKADIERQRLELGEMLDDRGFKTMEGINRSDRQVQAGKLLAPTGAVKATEAGVTFTGNRADLMTPTEAVRRLGRDEAERRADNVALELSEAIKMAEARLTSLQTQRKDQAQRVRTFDNEAAANIAGAATVQSERAQLAGLEGQIETVEKNLKRMRAEAQSAVNAVEAVSRAGASRPSPRSAGITSEAGEAAAKAEQEERQRQARIEQLRDQARVRELRAQGKSDEAELQQLRNAHKQQIIEYQSLNASVIELQKLHAAEEKALEQRQAEDKARDDEARAQREREERQRRAEEVAALRTDVSQRLLMQQGSEYEARLADLNEQHMREREIARGQADLLLAIDRYYAEEKRRLLVDAFDATIQDIQGTGQAVGGSVQSILGSLSSMRRARLQSAKADLKAGKISKQAYEEQSKAAFEAERKVIIAKGVMSTFLAATEAALALTAFASGPAGYAQGVAHLAASAAHAANAAEAGTMANAAYRADPGPLGASGGGSRQPDYGTQTMSGDTTQPSDLEQDRGPRIQFGDIVLSDVPALLSSDGVNHLGRQIAQSVTDEINRQQEIPGGFRMNGG